MKLCIRLFGFTTSVFFMALTLNAAKPVDFAREVLPILSNKCFVCHGPDGEEKDVLRLDSFKEATRDLDGYKAIDPASPEKSEFLVRLHDKEDPMPPPKAEKQLTRVEVDILTRWVKEGGKYAKHWAFVSPKKAKLPTKGNPIDAFVGAKLKEVGFANIADKPTLARRVALILTGLPPEPKQLERFLNDKRVDAYGRLVDELLASPRYGEHQARYWLDAVRYGDTHGLHLDNKRAIYPYRDWVVSAFNRNQPLNEFLTWQLAGDLLPKPTLAQQVATGFVRMNPTTAEGGAIPAEFQAKNNFDRVETLGTALLGMSLTCARCHTHKYDPIPQVEYYQMMAFFNSTAESSMDGNRYEYGPTVKAPPDVAAWTQLEALEGALAKSAQGKHPPVTAKHNIESFPAIEARFVRFTITRSSASQPCIDELEIFSGSENLALASKGAKASSDGDFKHPAHKLAHINDGQYGNAKSWIAARNTGWVQIELPKSARINRIEWARDRQGKNGDRVPIGYRIEAGLKEGEWKVITSSKDRQPFKGGQPAKKLDELKKRFTSTLVARDLPKPRETKLLERGEYNLPKGEPLQPGVFAVMGALPKDAPANRLGLAQWLTTRGHPLVSRVLINRVWQRTFGEGLVRTPADFGLQGEQPTHPKLLDWLAVELQDQKWNLKAMLRLMVTSRTFKQSSAYRTKVSDPENRLWARGPSHRLDAEALRDIVLWASGLLDPNMGGEGVKPYQPAGLWKALMHPGSNTKNYVTDKDTRQYRRSLYVYWKRTSPHPMMTLFDAPSRESSCVKRSRTSTPTQSLALLNEKQRVEMGRNLGQRLLLEAKDDANRMNLLFTLVASRKPTVAERSACMDLLQNLQGRYKDNEKDAQAFLSAGDSPRDEKLNPADHAAWAQVSLTVLASDIALRVY